MIDREREDRLFEAEVMLVYRLSHGNQYFTEEYLSHKQEYPGEIYRIIGANKEEIQDPALTALRI